MQKSGRKKGFPARANSFNTGTQIQGYFWTHLVTLHQIHLCPNFSQLCLTLNNFASICLSTCWLANHLFHSHSAFHTASSLDQHFLSFPFPPQPFWTKAASLTAQLQTRPHRRQNLAQSTCSPTPVWCTYSCAGTLVSLENNLCPTGLCGHCQWDHAAQLFPILLAWREREREGEAILCYFCAYQEI